LLPARAIVHDDILLIQKNTRRVEAPFSISRTGGCQIRFTYVTTTDKIRHMSTINAILEVDVDGTLHLPLPPELRKGRIEVTATLRAANTDAESRDASERVQRRKMALQELRNLGGLSDVIPDPAAWQREIRQDRSLPGRD